MNFKLLAAAAALAITASATPAAAYYAFGFSGGPQTLVVNGSSTISTANTGWFRDDGLPSAGNTNYIVGDLGSVYHDFFVFDSGGGASSLTLQLDPASFDFSDAPSGFTLTLYDVSSAIDTSQQYSDTGIYADLGSGTVYGSVSFTSQPGGPISISLNSAGIAAYNAAALGGTSFGVGGALSTGAVPEPATWALMIGGFAMTGFAARRRRNAVSA